MKQSFAGLILASLACVRGQDLNTTIVGCAGLDCPASSADTANDNCTVVDNSFTYVGLIRAPTTQDSLKGVSWTKGFHIVDLPGNNRTFQSSFFLGMPPDLKLRDTGACSVFLHGVSASLSFGDDGADVETSQGTCANAMGSECVDALLERARNFFKDTKTSNNSDADLCSALQDDIHQNMDDACLRVSKGSWTNLTSTALTGNNAPQPISAADNSTSTCWPVLPKQYQLTNVADHIVQGTLLVADAEKAQFSITPILTVFYPSGDGSIVSAVGASLACAGVVGPPGASLDAIGDGSGGDGDEGSVVSMVPSSTMLATMGALLVVFFARC